MLIDGLRHDRPDAIREYVGIVLSNSVYPESFPVDYDYDFDVDTKELTLTVEVPTPDRISDIKEYCYVKAKDEILPTTLTLKDRKDRYARAVAAVALRTMHEIFEADRDRRISTIALTVQVASVDPATGRPCEVPLVAVGADQSVFMSFDLTRVEPAATLAHMKAAVSKNPFGLVPASLHGVRG